LKFSPIFAVCSDTAMSRQDNFFFLSCKRLFYILAICVLFCWYEVSIEYFFYFCSVMVFLFSLNVVFLLVGFSFFLFLFVGGASCVFYFYYTRLWFCLFWACESLEVSLAGWVIFSFCVGLCCVECRSGTIYLSACLEWVAGLYRFFLFGLCCGEYGMIYLSAGRGWVAGLYRFSSGIICRSCVI
jgi:hypothetical protein